jgi:hypothetical protein
MSSRSLELDRDLDRILYTLRLDIVPCGLQAPCLSPKISIQYLDPHRWTLAMIFKYFHGDGTYQREYLLGELFGI